MIIKDKLVFVIGGILDRFHMKFKLKYPITMPTNLLNKLVDNLTSKSGEFRDFYPSNNIELR